MKPIILLLFLSNCTYFYSYSRELETPYAERKDCLFHNYQELPHCKNYNFLPADKGVKMVKRETVYRDYGQYRGKFN